MLYYANLSLVFIAFWKFWRITRLSTTNYR